LVEARVDLKCAWLLNLTPSQEDVKSGESSESISPSCPSSTRPTFSEPEVLTCNPATVTDLSIGFDFGGPDLDLELTHYNETS
jgi:hypothetical protein